jgi:hypothetical protein
MATYNGYLLPDIFEYSGCERSRIKEARGFIEMDLLQEIGARNVRITSGRFLEQSYEQESTAIQSPRVAPLEIRWKQANSSSFQ